MPEFLTPEAVQLEICDGTPVITLAVQSPVDLAAGGWSLLNGLTMMVVDGPGDAGFLLPRLTPAGDIAPPGWDEAVERAEGSRVVFGTGPGAPAVVAHRLS